MKLFVVVAGVPRSIYDDFVSAPHKRLVGDGILVSAPLAANGPGRYTYSDKYFNELLRKLWDAFVPLAASPSSELGILVVALDHGGDSYPSVVRRFFPFAWICRVLAPYVDFENGAQRRQAKNALVEQVSGTVRDQIPKLNLLKHELSSRRTRTPLLLPRRNFRSGHLTTLLETLTTELPGIEDVRKLISQKNDDFESVHPLTTVGDDPKRYFQDDRGLVFKATGDHGFVSGALGNHKIECRLAGRSRLGAPYLAKFHYDCEMNRGRVSGDFPNCHDFNESTTGCDYINIAPNDFIRIAGQQKV